MCSKYVKCSKFSTQRGCKVNMYDHLMSTRMKFTLTMNKKFMRASKNHENSGYNFDLDLLTML